jgi:hypothetical protein
MPVSNIKGKNVRIDGWKVTALNACKACLDDGLFMILCSQGTPKAALDAPSSLDM